MIDAELPVARLRRRVSPVTRALRPTQVGIGELQVRLAFLTAKTRFAQRKDWAAEIDADLAQCSELVSRLRTSLDESVSTLPPKCMSDTRIADTRLALERAQEAVASLGRSSQ